MSEGGGAGEGAAAPQILADQKVLPGRGGLPPGFLTLAACLSLTNQKEALDNHIALKVVLGGSRITSLLGFSEISKILLQVQN